MKKEVFIAISIGLAIGFLVVFGIYTANNALKGQEIKKEEALKTLEPQNAPAPALSLEPEKTINLAVLEPEDETVIDKETTIIKGKTNVKANLVVIGEKDEVLAETNQNGEFEAEIELIAGANEIQIAAYDNEGNTAEKTLLLVYSTEFK